MILMKESILVLSFTARLLFGEMYTLNKRPSLPGPSTFYSILVFIYSIPYFISETIMGGGVINMNYIFTVDDAKPRILKKSV